MSGPSSLRIVDLPAEVLMRCVHFMSPNDTQTFRLVCHRTRNIVDGDSQSPFWSVHAKAFFKLQKDALSGIQQLEGIAAKSDIAKASKDTIFFDVDRTTTADVLLKYDEIFRQQNVKYGMHFEDYKVSSELYQTIASLDLAAESVKYSGNIPGKDQSGQMQRNAILPKLKSLTLDTYACADLTQNVSPSDCKNLKTLRLEAPISNRFFEDKEVEKLLASGLEEFVVRTEHGCFASLPIEKLDRLVKLDVRGNSNFAIDFFKVSVTLRRLVITDTGHLTSLAGVERLTNLVTLDCSRCFLSAFVDMSAMENLRYLNVSRNDIKVLDSAHLPPRLIVLDCAFQIRFGARDFLLQHLPSTLKTLRIDWHCEVWPKDECNLIALPTNLEYLHLAGDDLLQIEEPTTKSVALCLTDDRLTNLQALLFPANLKHLNVSDNHIQSLEGVQLPAGLEVLDISGNLLTSLNNFVMPRTLHTLNAADNLINVVDCRLFPACLKRMNLQKNMIQEISHLEHFVALWSLELGDNILSALGPLPPHLVKLVLAGNPMSFLDDIALPSTLYTLDLRRTCIPRLSKFQCNVNLAVLLLRECRIACLRDLRINDNLKVLDVVRLMCPDLHQITLPSSLRKLFVLRGHGKFYRSLRSSPNLCMQRYVYSPSDYYPSGRVSYS